MDRGLSNAQLLPYQIAVYDQEASKSHDDHFAVWVRVHALSACRRTAVKHTGRSRYEDKTGLVIRDLKTGDEKWLAYPVQRDDQESIATMGVLPGMCFMPDSKSLVASMWARCIGYQSKGALRRGLRSVLT